MHQNLPIKYTESLLPRVFRHLFYCFSMLLFVKNLRTFMPNSSLLVECSILGLSLICPHFIPHGTKFPHLYRENQL